MGLTYEYFKIQKYFQKKYGDNTVVLMQVGSFYEIYGYDPSYTDQQIMNENLGNVALKFSLKSSQSTTRPEHSNGSIITLDNTINDQEKMGLALDMSMILNMKLTSKSTNKPHSLTNPLLVGFPCAAYESHRDVILFYGYTIIRIDQKDKKADGENVEREVVEISSPGTEIDNSTAIQATRTNTVVSIYIEITNTGKNKRNIENNMLLCGLSSIDVSTGRNLVAEIYSREHDEVYAIHEIYRFLVTQKPIEIIVNIDKVPSNQIDDYVAYLSDALELEKYMTKIVRCNQVDPNFLKDEYQEQLLRKAFTPSGSNKLPFLQPGTSSVIYDLGLERFRYGVISYTILLQYCHEHNENIIQKLQKPEVNWTDQNGHLILTHNAMLQLDIFPKYNVGYNVPRRQKTFDSLISVVDSTSTAIGARYLRRQLLNPITNVKKLESLYAMTNEFVNDDTLLKMMDTALRKIPDIEKFQRKIQVGLIRPKEFVNLFRAYLSIQEIYLMLHNRCFVEKKSKSLQELFMSQSDVTDFNEALKETWSLVNFDKLDRVKFTSRIGGKQQKMQCEESFINPGQDEEIDQIQSTLQQYQKWLQAICDHLNGLLTSRVKKIDIIFERTKSNGKKKEDRDDTDEDNSTGELSVYLQTTSAAAKQLRSYNNINQELCGALTFHEINKTKTTITSDLIRQCCQGIEVYQSMLESKLLVKFYEIVGRLSSRTYFAGLAYFLGTLDYVKSNAQIALKYKYYRPTIEKKHRSSFFKALNLRHPLIERIIRYEYVPNDLSLGESSSKLPNGLLLFGVNSTGKSSLAKAIGCVIMMAQAGMFVPAQLTYKPFTKIITRLSGDDDLLRGKSSFVVEMTELRTILRNADQNTLVLGDELCRGTESMAGTSLTVATLETLIERNTKFIFSTHMHHLPAIKLIQNYRQNNRLRIAHLTAVYDENLDRLTYNRRLEEGPGSSQYGLEVCKSLNIDKGFIDRANVIRRQLEEIPDLFLTTKKSRYNSNLYLDKCSLCGSQQNLHTHHLREQFTADQNGFIGHIHKDASHNLVVLCQECHQNIHRNAIELKPQQTLNGVYLEPVLANL